MTTDHIAPDALIELDIPGATGPLPAPPANAGETLWGINHGAAVDNFPLHGLQVYVQAWSSMNTGDSVDVLLDRTTVVVSKLIGDGEANQRVTTFVPAQRLTPGRHTLHYSVKRFGQQPDPSAETNVYVKLTRPGGQDQDGDTPGHSELIFTLPQDVINNGVDADRAKAGVPVTIADYPEKTARDTIRLSWGGQFVDYEVTEADLAKPIVITVEEATILAAGDSGANGLAVTFEVYDLVENRSEDWAAEVRITVETDTSRLPTPFIKEARRNVLDLNELGDAPVTVQVTAREDAQTLEDFKAAIGTQRVETLKASMGKETLEGLFAFKAGFEYDDLIIVTLTGTTQDGDLITYEADEVIIDNLPGIYEILIPASVVRQLVKTQAVFAYRLIKPDGSEAKSKGAFIQIEGDIVRMAAPVAKDASDGALDSDLTSTRIEIPWDDGMGSGDQLTLKWLGTKPDLTLYDPELSPHAITDGEASSQLPITIIVLGTHLKIIEGGTLELYYLHEKEVKRVNPNAVGRKGIIKRESLHASPLAVRKAIVLDPPKITSFTDPEGTDIPGNGTTFFVIVTVTGSAPADQQVEVFDGSVAKGIATANASGVWTYTLTALAPGLHAIKAVGQYGDKPDSGVRNFTVLVVTAVAITGVVDSKGTPIANGGITTDTTVTISGTVTY